MTRHMITATECDGCGDRNVDLVLRGDRFLCGACLQRTLVEEQRLVAGGEGREDSDISDTFVGLIWLFSIVGAAFTLCCMIGGFMAFWHWCWN